MPSPIVAAMNAVSPDLQIQSSFVPVCPDDKIMVHVTAFGVTRTDLHDLKSNHGTPLGVEFSGHVTRVGAKVTSYEVGDRVAGFVYEGAWAQFVVCDPQHVFHVPKRLRMAEAALLPVAWFSAIDALQTGGFKKRDKVVVYFGSQYSDVAFALVQHAQVVGCRRVFAVVSNNQEYGYIKANSKLLGALPDEVAVIEQENWAATVKQWDPKGVQLVFSESSLGLNEAAQVLAPGGSLVYLAPQLAIKGDMTALVNSRIRVSSVNVRASPPKHIAAINEFFKDRIHDRFANGRLKPGLCLEVPWHEVRRAVAEAKFKAVACLVSR